MSATGEFIKHEYPTDPGLQPGMVEKELGAFDQEVGAAMSSLQTEFDRNTANMQLSTEEKAQKQNDYYEGVRDMVLAGTVKMLLEVGMGTGEVGSEARRAVVADTDILEKEARAKVANALGITPRDPLTETEVVETKGLEGTRTTVSEMQAKLPEAVDEAVLNLRDINQVGTANLGKKFSDLLAEQVGRETPQPPTSQEPNPNTQV